MADSATRAKVEGYVALVFVQLCFGLFPLFVRLATDPGGGFVPRALAFWRIVVGAVVLGGLAWGVHGRAFFPTRGDLGRLFVCSFLGIALNQLLALEGVARTSATQAGVLMTLIPVFTYAIAMLVRQEPFVRRRALGIGVALAGAVCLAVQRGNGFPGADPRLGNLLIVGNSLAYAGFLVLARRLLSRYSTLVVIAWSFVLSLWTLPLLATGVDLWPRELTSRAVQGLIFLLLLPTVIGYLLNTFALARVAASTTAVFIYFQPLVSAGSGIWLLDERPGLGIAAAAGLLFAGIWLVLGPRRR